MAIIGEKITLDKPLVGNIARNQMESKMELAMRGALYVGTGKKTEVTPDGGGDKVPIPETLHIAPNGADDNGKVLVADSKETVGWKITKITADNLEGGRVAQATNADQATKADTVSYDGNYKSFIDAFVSACLLKIYPVGSIYMSIKDVDPSTFLGGTWERWGQGRVPVGVDVDASDPPDTDFATAGKEGGEKQHTLTTSETPTHTHDISVKPDRSGYGGSIYITTEQGSYVKYLPTANSTNNRIGLEAGLGSPDSVVLMSNVGGGKPHNNLQPYITCYMWKRTA